MAAPVKMGALLLPLLLLCAARLQHARAQPPRIGAPACSLPGHT